MKISNSPPPPPPSEDLGTSLVSVSDLDPFASQGQTQFSPFQYSIYDGGKFSGGFGPTQVQHIDYWTLRQRSAQLYNENLYARGLIRRLVTNEINTGLTPEACPDGIILGIDEDKLNDWTENVENRFHIWGKNPSVSDWKKQLSFGAKMANARIEAFVTGDVLVVLRQDRRTGLPVVQLVSGNKVMSPLGSAADVNPRNTIRHGVEQDAEGRVVAHWVKQDDGSIKRIPAFGARTGRRISWLVYGTDKRLDDVRGQPILALVLQSLKEIDRYRDSTQRKAVINSILAMFIKKNNDKMGTLPVTGGAVRKDQAAVGGVDSGTRRFNITEHIPGVVMEELQTGEEPVGFGSNGTDTNFGTFEEAIIQAVAWANEIPPEILRLAFSNNYSASQAAINEFKIYLNKVWSEWGEAYCTPIYTEWLISEALQQKITAPGLLEAWRDPRKYDIFGAWTDVVWYGSIKPSTDMLKQAKGSKMLVDEGWSTNAREARITTGTKYSKNIKRLKYENQQKIEAMRPLLEFMQQMGPPNQPGQTGTAAAVSALEDAAESMISLVEERS